ncbi:hypothetical protein Slin15195_G046580 [Septoria linicola]|uniref:Uncharacterized protein n=1 Tax=Septoria linicola TaxID=215465 RepID=A0A9Q9AND9_9PEZI|nr:hypothetical protein Slin15195_G046580 [Septoria linicola]
MYAHRQYQASIRECDNPYELQDIPSRSREAINPFDSVLELDDISVERPQPVYPRVKPGSTAAWIRARRETHPYPHITTAPPEEETLSHCPDDVERQSVEKRRPCIMCLDKSVSGLIGMILLLVMVMLVAVGVMASLGKLSAYRNEAGECRMFGGVHVDEYRCEGLKGGGGQGP